MTHCVIYLDESGDLGFKFTAPYRAGGSSRYLTLGAVTCPEDSKKYIKRFIADFYAARALSAGSELKWADLSKPDREDFALRAAKLKAAHSEIEFSTITVNKQNVLPHIRTDPNKLYNYMVALLLLKTMRKFDTVTLVLDARSIKVKSGNSMHDYLQIGLWFEENVGTRLISMPSDSAKTTALHFTDYVCGAFQSHHEDGATAASKILSPVTASKRLFF